MKFNRRDFLKGTAATAGSLLLGTLESNPKQTYAARPISSKSDRFAMLTDLTRCVGCRSCERACIKASNLPMPKIGFFADVSVFQQKRRPDAQSYTVVNLYENRKWRKPVYRKLQCNHCSEPACASACLVGALKKTPEGAVIYDEEVCIGCRYCMTACPFYIPAFEYFNASSPAIRKCNMCYHRIVNGMTPACAEACGVQAITFGKRNKLIKLARERIRTWPDRYIDHIYGEYEAGGTDWLHISPVPFEELDFPMGLGTTPFPEFTREFLAAVPFVLVVWPALFGGIYAFSRRREQIAEATNQKKEDTKR
ncbi:MAG: 4Fe-4S dicluster domain-containing protein [Deltaproteobacteria bacterium]|nr:4Fe-4S dicluster domain-containing protein [Deltaproteobacteria bacterium]